MTERKTFIPIKLGPGSESDAIEPGCDFPRKSLIVRESAGVLHALLYETDGASRGSRPSRGWGVLGGKTLFEAHRSDNTPRNYEAVRVQFHGGRQQWLFQHERYNAITQAKDSIIFAPLEDALALFEKATELKVAPVQIADLGRGVATHYPGRVEKSDANPWELDEAKEYTVMRKMGQLARFAVSHGRLYPAGGNPLEALEPRIALSGDELLDLRCDGRRVFDRPRG